MQGLEGWEGGSAAAVQGRGNSAWQSFRKCATRHVRHSPFQARDGLLESVSLLHGSSGSGALPWRHHLSVSLLWLLLLGLLLLWSPLLGLLLLGLLLLWSPLLWLLLLLSQHLPLDQVTAVVGCG